MMACKHALLMRWMRVLRSRMMCSGRCLPAHVCQQGDKGSSELVLCKCMCMSHLNNQLHTSIHACCHPFLAPVMSCESRFVCAM